MLHSKLTGITEEDVRAAIDEYLTAYPEDALHLKRIAMWAGARIGARMEGANCGSGDSGI